MTPTDTDRAREVVQHHAAWLASAGIALGGQDHLAHSIAQALAAVREEARREERGGWLFILKDALADLPDKPFDAEATLRAAIRGQEA